MPVTTGLTLLISGEPVGKSGILIDGVKIDYVLKNRQRVRVLNGLDLVIRPGEFVSIVGPSGCGKTTLLRAVAQLVTPSEGRITISNGGSRFPLSMVFQRPNLLPWLTVRQNAELPFRLTHEPWTEPARQRLNALLATVGLFGFQDALPHELSGGMQMRASVPSMRPRETVWGLRRSTCGAVAPAPLRSSRTISEKPCTWPIE
jgi:NitT/TauT family transport system ATP-binding protein